MSNPRKHCELIKAWADGATIEIYNENKETWYECTGLISWKNYNKYRVKVRDFKTGVFYPVKVTDSLDDDVGYCFEGADGLIYFELTGKRERFMVTELHWIGEPLPETLWEKEDD